MISRHKLASAIGALILSATSALAVPLAPGDVIMTFGTTFAANNELGGVVQNDNLIEFRMDPTPATPFTDVGGNVQNRVVSSGVTDQLIFSPRIRDTFNIDGGTFAITAFQIDGYAGVQTDVDFRVDGLGDKGFTSVSRSVDGDIMTFRYGNPLLVDAIAPGAQETSRFPSIYTDAKDFALTGTMTIFGQLFDRSLGAPLTGDVVSVTIDGVAVPQIAPVPIPAGGALILTALCALGILRRRQA